MSNGKWIKYNDTLVCPECGFGYFPNYYYFKNHECILNPFSEQYIFKICPDCGNYNGEVQDDEGI